MTNKSQLTTKDLLQLHRDLCDSARSIMEAKNHDYTAGSSDVFANFRATEILGVPAALGILIRCVDKFQRIRSFATLGTLKVKNEPVRDAIRDVINYMVLLDGLLVESEINEVHDRQPASG